MYRIRVLLGILGLDQHEVGAKAVSQILRNAGMEVIYVGRFNTPQTMLKAALDEDVDVIGLSCYSWEFLYYLPELMEMLRERGLSIPVVVGGGILSTKDTLQLKEMGVSAVFGPGAPADMIVKGMKEVVKDKG